MTLGKPVGELVEAYGNEVTEFIRDGIVYRLVWAVEAVRVHALVRGKIEAGGIGIAGLALTYGASSIASCLLLDSGFPSRVMAARLLAAYPSTYTDRRGFRSWLQDVIRNLNPATLWQNEGARRLWSEYLSRWSSRNGGRWKHETKHAAVQWTSGPLEPGTQVRIVHDVRHAETRVYSPNFTFLGTLKEPLSELSRCHVTAFVSRNVNSVEIRSFGPGA